MSNTAWWIWIAFMVIFLVPPMGYGWGYRGWGPPYPSYLQRRRHEMARASGRDGSFDHYSWGWGGDAVWFIALLGGVWMMSLFWWPSGYVFR